jgi:hypothetical protein
MPSPAVKSASLKSRDGARVGESGGHAGDS